MAPIKRKGNAPEERNTRQPQKRAKVDAEETKEHSKSKDTALKSSELSVLRDDEPSFPRGGGSVLTPLERKQIQIQANKDVLFEQKGQKKQAREFDDANDEDEGDVDMEDADAAAAPKKSKKRKTKGKKSADKEPAEKQGVRIEPLSYKVRRCSSKSGPKLWLMVTAHRTWVHDLRSGFEYHCPRHRPFTTEQPCRLCAPHVGL